MSRDRASERLGEDVYTLSPTEPDESPALVLFTVELVCL
jgi:hypothetical protein